ncbi:MAG: hypothetical protein BWY83_02677 [bacterium ADurb.Bin478]|nr:MAG: hypothetical protein BWY83_02677 [bacterium ADurb.Bin478]
MAGTSLPSLASSWKTFSPPQASLWNCTSRLCEAQAPELPQGVEAAVAKLKQREEKLRMTLGKLKATIAIASKNRTWNLGTSQKSYIDPRVYYNWGRQVDYDVIGKYYSTTLRRKFMWVKAGETAEADEETE